MIFSKSQKESIISRITFIESEMAELLQNQKITWQVYLNDKPARRNVERMIENIVNAIIDLSKIVLSDQASGEIPGSYQDVVLKLAQMNILEAENAQKLAEFIKFRNFLAHQYLDLRWDKVKSFLLDAPSQVELFVKAVRKSV